MKVLPNLILAIKFILNSKINFCKINQFITCLMSIALFDMPNPINTIFYRYRYFAKFPYRYRYRYRYFQESPYRYRYFQEWPCRYRYFSNCPYRYRYRYRYFQNFFIDIDTDIDIFKNCLSIFCRYRYSHKKRRYFIDISKNADISTIDIDISSKKHEKSLKSVEKNDFFTQNVLIDIDINIDIFKIVLIDIDIFKKVLFDIDIDISKIVLIDIDSDIDIFQNGLIDIDIFNIVLIDIDIDINIFQKCRYNISYRYIEHHYMEIQLKR